MPLGGEVAWNAFWTLHGDRPMFTQGFGTPMGATIIEPIPGRIPFQAIDCYARRFDIAGEAFDLLFMLVGELDREYLDFAAERSRARWEGWQREAKTH
jgi:hypothetical protein